MALIFVCCTSTLVHADNKADALNAIDDTADRICGFAASNGESQKTKIEGDVKAQLSGLVRHLADLGISGAGSVEIDNYVGVLQNDLPSTLSSIRDCKLKVFESLQEKFFPSGSVTPALWPRYSTSQTATSLPDMIGGHDSINLDNLANLSVRAPYSNSYVRLILNGFCTNLPGYQRGNYQVLGVRICSTPASYYFDRDHRTYQVTISNRAFSVTLLEISQLPKQSDGDRIDYEYKFGITEK